MDLWAQLSLIAALIVINGALAGSELALVSLGDARAETLIDRGTRGRALARLAATPTRYLATIQIGITLAGFLASATAAVSLARRLEGAIGDLGGAGEPLAIVVVTALLAYVNLVVGELAPKRFAMRHAERWSLLVAQPLTALALATRPLVWVLSVSTDALVRLGGVRGGEDDRERWSPDEIRRIVLARGGLSASHERIVGSALEVAQIRLAEVMVPRPALLALDASLPADEALRILVAEGRQRAPVHAGDLDDTVGLVHIRDLIDAQGPVSDHVRDALFLPEQGTVLDALRVMQQARQQMALVVNEHGGVDGLITVEDLVEEIVGEIYDEFDPGHTGVRQLPDGAMELPGNFPAHDLPDYGIALPRGTYATVAGFVLEELGRLPRPGDAVRAAGWRVEVLEVKRRAIARVRVTADPESVEED